MVVDDKHRSRGKQREKLTKEAACETRKIAKIFRCKVRKVLRPRRQERPRQLREVVEECRRIGVAGVAVIPEGWGASGLEPACDEGGFAGPGWAGYPDAGMAQ